MQKKLFIGIDLDPHLKKTLTKLIKPWADLPVRWHSEESLHVMLLSLGHVNEDQVTDIIARVHEACEQVEAFDVQFEQIDYGYKGAESADPKDAKKVWLTGEASVELKELSEHLEKALGMFVTEKKAFRPHVTLGRMRAKKWQDLGAYPVIAQPCPVILDVTTVTIFESVSIDGKREYVPLDVCGLN